MASFRADGTRFKKADALTKTSGLIVYRAKSVRRIVQVPQYDSEGIEIGYLPRKIEGQMLCKMVLINENYEIPLSLRRWFRLNKNKQEQEGCE